MCAGTQYESCPEDYECELFLASDLSLSYNIDWCPTVISFKLARKCCGMLLEKDIDIQEYTKCEYCNTHAPGQGSHTGFGCYRGFL